MKVEVALEWFLNPDHLPLIVGIQEGWFADEGLDLSLKAPDDHYDGMASVAAGEVAFAVNEPLHMLDEARPGLRACGCLTLLAGGAVRIASPVAGGKTDDICRLILQRWAAGQGRDVAVDQVAIEEAGFHHLDNISQGYDGAWLCFENFEGVQARLMGLDAVFVKTADAGLPNFSALELFTSAAFVRDHLSAVEAVQRVLDRAVAKLQQEEAAFAREAWYAFSGEERAPLTDAIVADTLGRFAAPVRADPERWRPLFESFERLGLSAVDRQGYDALFAAPEGVEPT